MPRASLVTGALAKTSFQDAWSVDVPRAAPYDVDALARVLETSAPRWADGLMWLRDRIVTPLGLRRSTKAPPRDPTAPFKQGDMLAIFPVLDRTADEILCGMDDKHLDFRVSLMVQRDGAAPSAVLSTVVRYNNGLGRVYFFFVRPFHRVILRSLMGNFAKKLAS